MRSHRLAAPARKGGMRGPLNVAVSYTHLDVYKRQALTGVLSMRSLVVAEHADRLKDLAYRDVDVYKRQL